MASSSKKKSFWKSFGARLTTVREAMGHMRESKQRSFEKAQVPSLKGKGVQRMVIDIPAVTVARSTAAFLLVLILFYFIYDIRGTLLILFISFLFAAALDPLIDYCKARGVPRAASVLGVYVILFILVGLFVSNLVTLVAAQVSGIADGVGQFVANLGSGNYSSFPFAAELRPYVERFYETVDVQAAAVNLQDWFGVVYDQLISFSFGLFNLLLVMVITFFLTVDEGAIEKFFSALAPAQYADYISTRLTAVKDQIGLWLRGQLLVSIISALLSYVGLVIMGIEYALTLSIIAGIAMIVPGIGRSIAWVLTFPIVFNQSPTLALWMSIYYLILQQFEANVLATYVMNKAVGLHPIIIIVAILIGGQYLQLMGLVLAVPMATTLSIFVKDYVRTKG